MDGPSLNRFRGQAASGSDAAADRGRGRHLHVALVGGDAHAAGAAQERIVAAVFGRVAAAGPPRRRHLLLDLLVAGAHHAHLKTAQVRPSRSLLFSCFSLERLILFVTFLVPRNAVKLSLYYHFTNTLIFSVVASMIFMIWSIYYHKMNVCLTVRVAIKKFHLFVQILLRLQ